MNYLAGASSAPEPVKREPLTVRVERLTGPGMTPADAFAAYQVVFSCTMLESAKRVLAWESDLTDCATLTQRQRADSLAQLKLAAKEGVPGASLAYYHAGPLGDGDKNSRPDDPNTKEWKQLAFEYVRRDALKADLNALATLSDIYQVGDIAPADRKLALAYADATARVKQAQTGKASPNMQDNVVALSREMTPAEIAEAKAIASSVAKEPK